MDFRGPKNPIGFFWLGLQNHKILTVLRNLVPDMLRNENSKEDYYYILKEVVFISDIIRTLKS